MDSSCIKCEDCSFKESFFGIISVLEPDQDELPGKEIQKEANGRIDLSKKYSDKFFFPLSLSKITRTASSHSLTSINDEISNLKQTVTSMIKQITITNKESKIKKEKFKNLEKACYKNKKKLKKMKNSVKSHKKILTNLEIFFKSSDNILSEKKTGKNRYDNNYIDNIKVPISSNKQYNTVNLAFGPSIKLRTSRLVSKNPSPRQLTQILVS